MQGRLPAHGWGMQGLPAGRGSHGDAIPSVTATWDMGHLGEILVQENTVCSLWFSLGAFDPLPLDP